MLEDVLKQHSFFPILGVALNESNTLQVELKNIKTELLHRTSSNSSLLQVYIQEKIKLAGKTYAAGGYLEDRNWYQRSPLFGSERTIHLAIDIWCNEGHEVFCPEDAIIHSFKNNEGFGNYGSTIILEHNLGEQKFYTLYGHLALKDLEEISVGKTISKGEIFAHVGGNTENGDWPCHLHFQIIKDIEDYVGDYPGVCSKEDLIFYKNNCPNPNLILMAPNL
jgi:murein DD-endopeptidase MepM/ murein hydrolase activator NlpD